MSERVFQQAQPYVDHAKERILAEAAVRDAANAEENAAKAAAEQLVVDQAAAAQEFAAKQAAEAEMFAAQQEGPEAVAKLEAARAAAKEQADKQARNEARANSPEVQLLNDAAAIEIFGTQGKTEGFVAAGGPYKSGPRKGEQKPLKEAVPGKVNDHRVAAQAEYEALQTELEEIRNNPRHGTVEADRKKAADARHNEAVTKINADVAKGDAKAREYVEDIRDVREEENVELCQAKLIVDLDESTHKAQDKQYDRLVKTYSTKEVTERDADGNITANRKLIPVDPKEASEKAHAEIDHRMLMRGDNKELTTKIIKEEGIFSLKEYNKFRYGNVRGDATKGETDKFKAYRDEAIREAQAKAKVKSVEQENARVEAGIKKRADEQKKAEQAKNNNMLKNFKKVQYEAGKDGYTQFGEEVTKDGAAVEWSRNKFTNPGYKDRQALITTASGEVMYLSGNELHFVSHSKRTKQSSKMELEDTDPDFPGLKIGESWSLDGFTTDPIAKVEIATTRLAIDPNADPKVIAQFKKDNLQRGKNPFASAKSHVEKLAKDEAAVAAAAKGPKPQTAPPKKFAGLRAALSFNKNKAKNPADNGKIVKRAVTILALAGAGVGTVYGVSKADAAPIKPAAPQEQTTAAPAVKQERQRDRGPDASQAIEIAKAALKANGNANPSNLEAMKYAMSMNSDRAEQAKQADLNDTEMQARIKSEARAKQSRELLATVKAQRAARETAERNEQINRAQAQQAAAELAARAAAEQR